MLKNQEFEIDFLIVFERYESLQRIDKHGLNWD